jgi:hypothetical protein
MLTMKRRNRALKLIDNVSKLRGIDYQQPNLGSQKYEINANNYTNKPGNIML